MAIPRFSFGSGASGLYNPNQILVPTTLTSADKTQLLDYDKKIADYKAQVDAYNKAVEAHNKSGKGTFSQKEPTDPGITQKEIDTFGAESAARAQQLQTARQNALNILQNPEGFSSYYGIGSLGFEEGGEVPVNFVGTGEFPETDPSVGYRTGPASQDKELPLVAELIADSIPVAGDVKAGIQAADYFSKGEYGNAALEGIGALPFIPPLAGIVKKYRNRYGDPEATSRRIDEIVEKYRREKAARESTPILDDLTIPESITSYVIAPEKVTRTEFITKLASDPKVLEKSQKALNDLGYGETVPMFRFVRINPARNKELLPESLISATLDPKKIKTNFKYMTDWKWSTGDEYRLLRYDVPREKIKAYLPALTEKINNRVNKKIKQKYIGQDKGALGSRTEVVKSPSRLANELIPMQDEILADVSEIKPQIIKTPEGKPQNILLSEGTAVTLPVSSGEVSSFDDLLKIYPSYKTMSPSKRKLNEKAIKEYQKFFSKGFEEGGAVGEGIGSLMQDNRYQEAKVFDPDYAEDAERYNYREELEQLNPSFRVGRYNIRPNISGSYQSSSVDIPENVDGKNVFINKRYKSGGGNLGFNVTTPNQHNFGAGASGNYFTGSMEFPEEIQAFGAPAKINYGEGLTPEQYYAYYSTPEGLSISGNYREGNPDQKSALEIMLSKQIKFKNIEDLTKRIERFLKRR